MVMLGAGLCGRGQGLCLGWSEVCMVIGDICFSADADECTETRWNSGSSTDRGMERLMHLPGASGTSKGWKRGKELVAREALRAYVRAGKCVQRLAGAVRSWNSL